MRSIKTFLRKLFFCAKLKIKQRDRREKPMNFDHRDEHLDDEMLLLQANLDDMNPEWHTYLVDLLFEAGANDVYLVPIIMKKGRPGVMLNVLIGKGQLEIMEEIIFRESTTLGIRYLHANCHRLGRSFDKVMTAWGEVTVKTGHYHGKLVQFAPEFRECEQLARLHKVPLKTVYDEVRRNFLARQNKERTP
jgi:uncharacterized protein (DUF111 family)